MSVILTSPITGGAQTGFTTPTYTHVADVAPDTNGRQVAVSAVGGTQVGVTFHSGSSPFTLMVSKPKSYKTLGKANPVTGVIANVPMNVYKFNVRKGMLPLAGQPFRTGMIQCIISIPAGADVADPANIRAMFSAFIGALTQQSAGFGDTAVSAIL
jgi:hypothetical protein